MKKKTTKHSARRKNQNASLMFVFRKKKVCLLHLLYTFSLFVYSLSFSLFLTHFCFWQKTVKTFVLTLYMLSQIPLSLFLFCSFSFFPLLLFPFLSLLIFSLFPFFSLLSFCSVFWLFSLSPFSFIFFFFVFPSVLFLFLHFLCLCSAALSHTCFFGLPVAYHIVLFFLLFFSSWPHICVGRKRRWARKAGGRKP